MGAATKERLGSISTTALDERISSIEQVIKRVLSASEWTQNEQRRLTANLVGASRKYVNSEHTATE
jgi:hypothetical protein